MKRFLSWFPHSPATRSTSVRRPQLEQFEDRLVPSTLSSAISIPHVSYFGGLPIRWTERDWYTVDRSTNHVVEFEGTTRHDLGVLPGITALSASVDPKTGRGDVFALRGYGELWRCDSSGTWYDLAWRSGGYYTSISATRDGHVFAVDPSVGELFSVDSYGNPTSLGSPAGGISRTNSVVAASVAGGGLFGSGDEAFVIGANQAIYVRVGNHWSLVDNSAKFVSLSATRDNTVFAVTASGKLYQETESIKINGWYIQTYWVGHDLSAGLTFTPTISADLDSSGQSEVYAVDVNGTLYQYDQGVYNEPWIGVTDVSGADGGQYYHVQYWYGHYDGYLNYTYLGSSNLS
jgi:hypothetical protein